MPAPTSTKGKRKGAVASETASPIKKLRSGFQMELPPPPLSPEKEPPKTKKPYQEAKSSPKKPAPRAPAGSRAKIQPVQPNASVSTTSSTKEFVKHKKYAEAKKEDSPKKDKKPVAVAKHPGISPAPNAKKPGAAAATKSSEQIPAVAPSPSITQAKNVVKPPQSAKVQMPASKVAANRSTSRSKIPHPSSPGVRLTESSGGRTRGGTGRSRSIGPQQHHVKVAKVTGEPHAETDGSEPKPPAGAVAKSPSGGTNSRRSRSQGSDASPATRRVRSNEGSRGSKIPVKKVSVVKNANTAGGGTKVLPSVKSKNAAKVENKEPTLKASSSSAETKSNTNAKGAKSDGSKVDESAELKEFLPVRASRSRGEEPVFKAADLPFPAARRLSASTLDTVKADVSPTTKKSDTKPLKTGVSKAPASQPDSKVGSNRDSSAESRKSSSPEKSNLIRGRLSKKRLAPVLTGMTLKPSANLSRRAAKPVSFVPPKRRAPVLSKAGKTSLISSAKASEKVVSKKAESASKPLEAAGVKSDETEQGSKLLAKNPVGRPRKSSVETAKTSQVVSSEKQTKVVKDATDPTAAKKTYLGSSHDAVRGRSAKRIVVAERDSGFKGKIPASLEDLATNRQTRSQLPSVATGSLPKPADDDTEGKAVLRKGRVLSPTGSDRMRASEPSKTTKVVSDLGRIKGAGLPTPTSPATSPKSAQSTVTVETAPTSLSPGKSSAAVSGQKATPGAKPPPVVKSLSSKKKMNRKVLTCPPPDVSELRKPILSLQASRRSQQAEAAKTALKKAKAMSKQSKSPSKSPQKVTAPSPPPKKSHKKKQPESDEAAAGKTEVTEEILLDAKLKKPASRALKVSTMGKKTVQKPKRISEPTSFTGSSTHGLISPEAELISRVAANVFNISPTKPSKKGGGRRKSEASLEALIKSQISQRGRFTMSGRAIKSGVGGGADATVDFLEEAGSGTSDSEPIVASVTSPKSAKKTSASLPSAEMKELIAVQRQQGGFTSSGRAVKRLLSEKSSDDEGKISAKKTPDERNKVPFVPKSTTSTSHKKGASKSPSKPSVTDDKSPGSAFVAPVYHPVSDRVKALQVKAQALVSQAKQKSAAVEKEKQKKKLAAERRKLAEMKKLAEEAEKKKSESKKSESKAVVSPLKTKGARKSTTPIKKTSTKKASTVGRPRKETPKPSSKKKGMAAKEELTVEEAAEAVRMLAQSRRVKTVPPLVRARSGSGKKGGPSVDLNTGGGGPLPQQLSPRYSLEHSGLPGTSGHHHHTLPPGAGFDIDQSLPSPSSSSTETDSEARMAAVSGGDFEVPGSGMGGPGGVDVPVGMLEVNAGDGGGGFHPGSAHGGGMAMTPPYRITKRRRTDTENLETVSLEWNTQDMALYSSLSALSQQQSAESSPTAPRQTSSTKRRSQRSRRSAGAASAKSEASGSGAGGDTGPLTNVYTPPTVRLPKVLLNDHCYIKQLPPVDGGGTDEDDGGSSAVDTSREFGDSDFPEERRSVVDVNESFRNIMAMGSNGLSSDSDGGTSGTGGVLSRAAQNNVMVVPGAHELLVDPYGHQGSIVVPASLSALVTAADLAGPSLVSSAPQIVTVPTSGTIPPPSGSPFLFHVPSTTIAGGPGSGYSTILSSFIDPHQASSSPPVVTVGDFGITTGGGVTGPAALSVPPNLGLGVGFPGLVSNPSDQQMASLGVAPQNLADAGNVAAVNSAVQFLDLLTGGGGVSHGDGSVVLDPGTTSAVGPDGGIYQQQLGGPFVLSQGTTNQVSTATPQLLDIVGALLQQPVGPAQISTVPTSGSLAGPMPALDPAVISSLTSSFSTVGGAVGMPNTAVTGLSAVTQQDVDILTSTFAPHLSVGAPSGGPSAGLPPVVVTSISLVEGPAGQHLLDVGSMTGSSSLDPSVSAAAVPIDPGDHHLPPTTTGFSDHPGSSGSGVPPPLGPCPSMGGAVLDPQAPHHQSPPIQATVPPPTASSSSSVPDSVPPTVPVPLVTTTSFAAQPQQSYYDPAAVVSSVGRGRPDLVPDFLPENILEGDVTDSS